MSSIKVSIDRIQIGNYIKLPVGWCDHPFMFNNFKIDSQHQIELIRKLGIAHVNVYPQKSDSELLPVQTEVIEPTAADDSEIDALKTALWQEKQQQIEKLKNYRRGLNKTEKRFDSAMAEVRSVMNKLADRPLNAVSEATELIDGIAESLLSQENLVLHLMNESKESENIYYHSLNVAMLAMLLGRLKKLPAQDIKTLGLGALFHDIGKMKIPAQILRKKEPLTKAENNFLKLHAQYGIDLVDLIDTFPAAAKPIISQHHEYLDGSGYPSGLKAKQIDPLAQLVTVANEYDNLCHPVNQAKARVPSNALSWLYKNTMDKLNRNDLNLLVKILGIYPPSTVVRLSNDKIGMVISVNTERLLFPSILIYDADIPRNEAPIIDLEDESLTITSVLKPDKLPQHIYDYLNPRSRINYYFEENDKNKGS